MTMQMAGLVLFLFLYAPIEFPEVPFGPDRISDELWLHSRVRELVDLPMGPFTRLQNGHILTVNDRQSYISEDEGTSWKTYDIFDSDRFLIRPERALITTRNGVVILAFSNDLEKANWDWQEDIHDSPGAILPTYAVRSMDGGITWETPQKLHSEWTGAIRDMIQTKDGSVIFTSQMMRHNPGRHAVVTYASKDDGKTWQRSNVIDLGGIGHHSGMIEGTIEQLEDGRIWMLIRTMWGKFWEAYSENEGLTWQGYDPTEIEASTAPGFLKRLASGRLVLIWNQRYPEGTREYPLRGGDGQWSEVEASNHRGELSMTFSDDEGLTWTDPVVIAKGRKNISYPYVFEVQPGRLWVTTWFGELRAELFEKDFAD